MRTLRHDLREETLFAGPGAEEVFSRAAEVLMGYRFYPSEILEGRVSTPDGRIREGALIDQRIRAGPLVFRGPVRVLDAWDRATSTGRAAGFRYEALEGHPERGTASFELVLDGSTVRLRIESRYALRHWLARLGAPFAQRLRRRAIDGAFDRMRGAAQGRSSP